MTVQTEPQKDEVLLILLIYFAGQTYKFLTQVTDTIGSLLLRHVRRLYCTFPTSGRHHVGEFFDAGVHRRPRPAPPRRKTADET